MAEEAEAAAQNTEENTEAFEAETADTAQMEAEAAAETSEDTRLSATLAVAFWIR